MAVGNPLPTSAFVLSVSDIPVVSYVPVSLINSWDGDYNATIAEFEVFGNPDTLQVNGKAKSTIQFGGFLADADSGQTLIAAHEAAKDLMMIKVLWDGTNGFSAKARVTTKKLSAKAGATLAEVMYTFTVVVSTITITGTGPAL